MKNIFFIALLFTFASAYGQKPFSEEIETDSSNIEIIRNSVYRVYEETFKKNDSIWYSVSYIDDTTQLHTEGWKLKNERYLGTWKEYDRKGNLLYTWDHDKHTCVVNRKLFPYHEILEKMKQVADSMIITEYGQEFMEKHIIFDFHCSGYNKYKTKYTWSQDSSWREDYLGSWTSPMTSKPNSFLLKYEVRLNPSDDQYIELGICLDEKGNYVASRDDRTNNYGFEHIQTPGKGFNIDKNRAIEKAIQLGSKEINPDKIDEFLFWESFRKQEYYNGQFRYYITELTEQREYKKGEARQGIIYRYKVYVFNPWTGEFVEIKKMKRIREWEKDSGFSTGLLPDNE